MTDGSRSSRPTAADWNREVVRIGRPRSLTRDVYARLLRARWRTLLALLATLYLASNAFFAGIYLLVPGSIDGARPGHFGDAFFFSVQTMSTIGYGRMLPHGLAGNILVTVEAFVGLLAFALVAGIVFAKFARPSAGLLFSDKAVVASRDGVPCLMFRVANARGNDVVEASVRLTALLDQETQEGHRMRRLHDLTLVRTSTPVLVMSWLVIHPLLESSPLYGMDADDLVNGDVRLVVSVTGLDALFDQAVYATMTYTASDVHFGVDFVDVISTLPDGRRQLDLSKFHDVRSVPAAGSPAGNA